MPTFSLLVCVGALWLAQRLLSTWQAMRFRRQLIDLRAAGKVSVGMAKAIGRRVFVGLAFDENGKVVSNLVLRGATVFAVGRSDPLLQGCSFEDLAVGKTPIGLPKLTAEASTQAGTFMADTRRREDARISAGAPLAEGQGAAEE